MELAKCEGRMVVFADEICFTKRSIKLREWSTKNTNLTVDQEDVYVSYRAVLASMTEENGILLAHVYDKPVKVPEFCAHLMKIRTKNGQRPVALFMDNLWLHKDAKVLELMAKLDIRPIYNVAYSPEFNPIEAVFSKVKRQFSCQRLHNLVTKIGFNMDTEIVNAFKTIKAAHCAACARKSLHLL